MTTILHKLSMVDDVKVRPSGLSVYTVDGYSSKGIFFVMHCLGMYKHVTHKGQFQVNRGEKTLKV